MQPDAIAEAQDAMLRCRDALAQASIRGSYREIEDAILALRLAKEALERAEAAGHAPP